MNFSQIIIRWYNKNKRDLPWRHTNDPYRIWLSEIILQQTRVQQGTPYYETFVKKFPTIHNLANAKEDVILRAWQGLGYYSRARNLHETAKYISKKLKGKFPREYEEILKLKGIGGYTAAAIASFAFNQPYPVVDGNVFRVLSRCFGITTPVDSTKGKQKFIKKAQLLLDKNHPGLFNQAIMEFGALQCIPQNPDCKKCPLNKSCNALQNNIVPNLPIKSKKGQTRTRHFNYFFIRKNSKILIKKRTGKDIWKNLYDFPMIESEKEISEKSFLKLFPANRIFSGKTRVTVKPGCSQIKHILSHQIILAKFWCLEDSTYNALMTGSKDPLNLIYVNENQIDKYAFPRLITRFFHEKMPFMN